MIKGPTKTEKEYRQVALDSSSSLKEFSLDRRKYYKKYYSNEPVEEEEEDSKASIVGRMVETLLFEKDEFDNRFYMSAVASSPTGKMLAFVEALYKHSKEATDEDGEITKPFVELAELAYKDSGFTWKLDIVLSKFIGSSAEVYYQEIRNVRSKGLTVVTVDDVENAERVVEGLKNSPNTGSILNLVNSERYTILIQHQIEGYTIDGLKLKSMMDLIIIDHQEKTIQVYDLKCVWAVEGFYTEYYLYRRAYIQAYLYYEACKYLSALEGLKDYTILYPKFIVCDSINYFLPLVYTLNADDMEDAYNGFEYNGRKYSGTKEIIEDLKWAKDNNEWRISRTNSLSEGVVSLTK